MPGATVLRDAIWGDVSLGPRELALIDTPAFQRLRRVRQLGLCDLVFPGARHTRFEHSIGVYHVATLVLERIRRSVDVSAADERALLAAALLHDIGHYPFSHAIEELELDQVRPHADIGRELIATSEIADELTRHWDVDPKLVGALVAGPAEGETLTETQVLLRSVLDSDLDVDKLDYLVRDAHGANVPYGVVDVQRLIGSLLVWHGGDGQPQLAIETKGVSALQSLVFAKHLMFATVYWHHACRAAVVMLLRAVQEALRAGGIEGGAIENLDDESLLGTLTASHAPLVSELGQRLRARRLYKRGVDVLTDDVAFDPLEQLWFRPTQRATLEDGWAAALGVEPGAVLLDIPEPRRITVDLPIVDDGEVTRWDEISGLSGDDLARFQRWVRIIRVFGATHEIGAELRDRWAELFTKT